MFLFARVKGVPFAQGKNREPGAKAHSCACRKIPSGILPEGKATPGKIFRNLLLSRFFCYYIYNVESKTGNGRVQSQKSAKSC